MVTILQGGYVVWAPPLNTTVTEVCADHINNIWMRSCEVIRNNLLKLKIVMICLETVEFCAVLYLASIFCMFCLCVSAGHLYCSKDWGQEVKQGSVFWKKLILKKKLLVKRSLGVFKVGETGSEMLHIFFHRSQAWWRTYSRSYHTIWTFRCKIRFLKRLKFSNSFPFPQAQSEQTHLLICMSVMWAWYLGILMWCMS